MSDVNICRMSIYVGCQYMSDVNICQMSIYVGCQYMSDINICQVLIVIRVDMRYFPMGVDIR